MYLSDFPVPYLSIDPLLSAVCPFCNQRIISAEFIFSKRGKGTMLEYHQLCPEKKNTLGDTSICYYAILTLLMSMRLEKNREK